MQMHMQNNSGYLANSHDNSYNNGSGSGHMQYNNGQVS